MITQNSCQVFPFIKPIMAKYFTKPIKANNLKILKNLKISKFVLHLIFKNSKIE